MDEGDEISISVMVTNVKEMVDLQRKNVIKKINFIISFLFDGH